MIFLSSNLYFFAKFTSPPPKKNQLSERGYILTVSQPFIGAKILLHLKEK